MFGIMEAACLSALFFLAGELGSSVIQSLNNLRDRTAKRLRQEAGAIKAAGAFSNGAQDELAGRHNIQNEAPPAADPQGEDHPTPGPSSPPFMRHRLRHCLPFWKTFCQSLLVLNWIEHGFDLRWISSPPNPIFLPNHRSAFDHSDFVTLTIYNLVMAGVLEPRPLQPYLVLPIGVVLKKSNLKPRLIFDAQYLNSHIVVPSFKYEDLGYTNQFINPGDYLVTTDFHSGYHHVDLHPDFHDYFGIEWNGLFYVFTSLPFGLASACWCFTKITRELIHKWRRVGHRCSGYLDDGLHAGMEVELSNFINNHVIPDTEYSGFLLNLEKSILIPSTRVKYLGMFIDTIRNCFEVPSEKREVVIKLLQSALASPHSCCVHTLEIIAGNLASMHWAFGPLSRLMTLSFYADIKRATRRYAHISLSENTINDLKFWLCGFDRYSGFNPIWEPVGFHMTIYTDAAGLNLQNYGGWAGWSTFNGQRLVARGIWTGDLLFDHSTAQELMAVFNTIQSFNRGDELRGKRILIKTDNQAVFYIINRAGSRDSHVHDLCKQLFWYCIHFNIRIQAVWIPRELNSFADYYSKLTDSSDWRLDTKVFRHLSSLWGGFDIDLFASFENNQTLRYYSYYFTPTATGINAFNFHWGKRCWCYPPYSLIPSVLSHAEACGSRLCLFCPFTPTAMWWPLLVTGNGSYFQPFTQDFMVIPRRPNLITPGRLAHSYTNRKPRWDFIALLINFSVSSPLGLLPVPHHPRAPTHLTAP